MHNNASGRPWHAHDEYKAIYFGPFRIPTPVSVAICLVDVFTGTGRSQVRLYRRIFGQIDSIRDFVRQVIPQSLGRSYGRLEVGCNAY